ncbi:MAG: glutamine-hydrolyzing carbamoyl-phosphate synthase small subunit [bacterium]
MRYKHKKKAILILKDGRSFEGFNFGAEGESGGEVVFTTSMCGYQEILTDPSYDKQIVCMTYTQIGNYGFNEEDMESRMPFVSGFVVKEYQDFPSNYRSKGRLEDFLKDYKIVGIEGIDTRALTAHLRDRGAMNGLISTIDFDRRSLMDKLNSLPSMVGLDLVKNVSTDNPYDWKKGLWTLDKGYVEQEDGKYFIVAYDYGIKYNILRNLVNAGFRVKVVPADFPADEVLKLNPDGIFLSNGPGDPEPVNYAIENVKKLVNKKPIFGICLGHQILGLALGGKTFKLKFGHRGGNQPVKDLTTGKVEVTSQNHGFAVDIDSLKGKAEVTHINLNDNTVEGLRHREYPIFSVQYHPEASPGPHDASYLFKRFYDLVSAVSSR